MKKIAIILIILLLTGCGTKEEQTNDIVVNQNINTEQTINDLYIDNVLLYYESGISNYQFNLTNKSDIEKNITTIKVTFKTSSGSIITTLEQPINQVIKKDESITIKMMSDIDLTHAHSVEYEVAA